MKKKILNYLITTLNGMAYGLFATLIVGTIIKVIGNYIFSSDNSTISFIRTLLTSTSTYLTYLTGVGIGVGIAMSLKETPLKTIVLGIIGGIGSYLSIPISNIKFDYIPSSFSVGDPLTIYFVCIISLLLLNLTLKKKTPVDILLIPLLGVITALIVSVLVRFPLIYVTYGIQYIVNKATLTIPLIMGVLVSVIMGMSLTAPISSAAIAAIVFSGTGEGLKLASGAAVIGCTTQMIGFAIQARKDNSIGMIISIGIGTSMLEFKNILKKPIIWLPTIITSAILGPLSTCIFKIKCLGANAGMGTAGLIGVIGSIDSSMNDGFSLKMLITILLLEVILPAILVFFIDLLFRKLNLIKKDDLKV